MKIAISASGPTLASPVDPRFGRCADFVFVNLDDDAFKAQTNTANTSGHGAGIQAAQFVAQQDVKTVITGRIGPNAAQVLYAAGVKVYIAKEMTVQEAVEAYQTGKLLAA